jgi:hypothetical protein
MARRVLAMLLFAAALAASGCDDDDDHYGDTGAPCDDDEQCMDRCARGPDWPGGMCTYECNTDEDCPGGTACVDRSGGVCAVLCEVNDDCHAYGFGGNWDCRDTDHRGGPGDVRVCRG